MLHGHTQVTSAGLKEMRFPGLLAVGMPIVVGLLFRFIGEATGRPLLGAEVLVSFIMFGTLTGILMALFLDNVGGAWVRGFVELGAFAPPSLTAFRSGQCEEVH
jgi:H+-translocating diphosphatase